MEMQQVYRILFWLDQDLLTCKSAFLYFLIVP